MTQTWTVIPDLHADPARLEATLRMLEPGPLAFLGDFIDAGRSTPCPDDAAVLNRVRDLVARGAVAVMGNHELNAILYHRLGVDGVPLRTRSGKNAAQHRSFVEAFGTATPAALEWTDWFLSLPLWLDLGGLRLVHACWNQPAIDVIAARRPDARLRAEDLAEVAAKTTPFARAVDTLLTGPEIALPAGHGFVDAHGHRRDRVRIAWWRSAEKTWAEAALSVPDPAQLPTGPLPHAPEITLYPADAPPVLIGHYKMQDGPRIEAPNAACLDYPNQPCAYRWCGEAVLSERQLVTVQPGA